MQEKKERWMELCELAAVEQDSQKLLALTQEINRLLAEKQERVDRARSNNFKLATRALFSNNGHLIH
jgi:hypothetical protein